MPFNDEIESGDFEYELVLPRQRLFFRDWPTLYYHHQPAARVKSGARTSFTRWIHLRLGWGNRLQLHLVPEHWPGLPGIAHVRSALGLVEGQLRKVHLELSPMRPGDPGSVLLLSGSVASKRGKTEFILCHFESAYAAVNQLGDVLVTYHGAWRDSDHSRGLLAGLKLHVGGNHPHVDQALILMTALAVVEPWLNVQATDLPTYSDLAAWFSQRT